MPSGLSENNQAVIKIGPKRKMKQRILKNRKTHRQKAKAAFTLTELVVAVALLAMLFGFSALIFNVSIEAHRTAGANSEIMQKLRAITDQLNRDFKELQKDGHLILHSYKLPDRADFAGSGNSVEFRSDRMYYFCTGDFQSWDNSGVKSNIGRVYFGHDSESLTNSAVFASECKLARDIMLLTPGNKLPDSYDISFAECKTTNDINSVLRDTNSLNNGVTINDLRDPINAAHIRKLLAENVGSVQIDWTDGRFDASNYMQWWGLNNLISDVVDPNLANILNESGETNKSYAAAWKPATNNTYWPKALKFTFTLYDSKGIIKNGKTFTHIVYIGD